MVITFETAKLVREKIFISSRLGSIENYYVPSGEMRYMPPMYHRELEGTEHYYAYEQAEIQTILRDAGIFIYPVSNGNGTWCTFIEHLNVTDHRSLKNSDTYEEALEKGLIEGLRLL